MLSTTLRAAVYEDLTEVLIHLMAFTAYAVLSVFFAGVGALLEYRSFLSISSGDLSVALWLGALGILMLAFSSLIVTDKLVGAYSDLRTQL